MRRNFGIGKAILIFLGGVLVGVAIHGLFQTIASRQKNASMAEAISRLHLAGLALEKHRFETKAFPENLSLLVPAYLQTLPMDPFENDRHPIRMQAVTSGNILIYSIGPDRKDDLGKPYDELTGRGDIVLRVW